jgi:pimeloyl-ACP methyl ester carboxylesterase
MRTLATIGCGIVGSLAALVLLPPAMGAPEGNGSALPPARRVEIGGFHLSMHLAGRGRPAVVLLSGMGDTAAVWSKVFPEVAKFTRVCAYDRAGEGDSEKSPARETLQQTVTELHRLLLAARVPPPYVLVGASWGGPIARVYAHQHPERVAGIVLVDATHEDTTLMINNKAIAPRTAPIDEWQALVGKPSPDKGDLRADLQLVHDTRENRPYPLGDLPLIALSQGKRSPEGKAMQADLARLSRRGRLTIVAQSGHRIHQDAPEAVIAAIREVVEAMRKVGKGGAPAEAGRSAVTE